MTCFHTDFSHGKMCGRLECYDKDVVAVCTALVMSVCYVVIRVVWWVHQVGAG
jgi:hypothetical protein